MKKFVFLLVMVIFLLLTNVLALNVTEANLIKEQAEGYQLPGFMAFLFGNERLNVHLTLEGGGVEIYQLIVEKGVITEFAVGEVGNPTIDVYAEEKVIVEIRTAEDKLRELESALDDGRITYQARGLLVKIKLFLATLFL